MKYKVGDRAKIRQWEAMKRQFGLDNNGDIKNHFSITMKRFYGKIVRIIAASEDCYNIYEDNAPYYCFNDTMFEGYAFEYGEEAEFSDDKEDWCKRILCWLYRWG